jgi:VanZ family protein
VTPPLASLRSLLDRLPPEWRHRLFVAYVVAMMLVFLTPMPDTGLVEPIYLDKAVHLGLFFGFALVLYIDRAASPGLTFLISTMFAGAVEIVQVVLPFREFEMGDFVAGAAGAGLGAVLVRWMGRHVSRVAPEPTQESEDP